MTTLSWLVTLIGGVCLGIAFCAKRLVSERRRFHQRLADAHDRMTFLDYRARSWMRRCAEYELIEEFVARGIITVPRTSPDGQPLSVSTIENLIR